MTQPIIKDYLSGFRYLGCNATYNYDEDLNKTRNTFQRMWDIISRMLKRKLEKTQI
jgi:hypothetical protein